jgi:Na+-translocating ferredoxin:NAD+ oxidoreductase RnfE subunit
MKLTLRLGKPTLVKLIAIGFCPALAVTATTVNWTGTSFASGDDAVFTGTPTNNVTILPSKS